MITIVARWEDSQLLPENEWQLWRQLKGAFQIDRLIFTPIKQEMSAYHLEQYETMAEALDTTDGQRVFLEPKGTKGLKDLPEGNIVLITGNTENDNLTHAKDGETYHIKSPSRTHLYPSEAVAIVLALRYGQ